MNSDQSSLLSQPSGGGIDTDSLAQSATVTQVVGTNSQPVREEDLRERFLTFDPIFDRAGQVVARELVLRGQPVSGSAQITDLAMMDEDMLLTGLYSLAADRLTGETPLMVRISNATLTSDTPLQLNQTNFIWLVNPDGEQNIDRIRELRGEGLEFCLDDCPLPVESARDWNYVRIPSMTDPSQLVGGPTYIVTGIRDNLELSHWPFDVWIQGLQHLGASAEDSAEEQRLKRMELLSVATRQNLDSLLAFVTLNPDLHPQLLRIAASPSSGLSIEPESAAHALVLLGPQRARRVAILLALAGLPSTADSRLCAKTALSRALFMGRLARIHGNATHASLAFETGLSSTYHVAFSMSIRSLSLKLGLAPEIRDALAGMGSQQNQLLRLAHACETNDGGNIALYSASLGLSLEDVSTAHLESVMMADALETSLI
jgi:c-di-GMP-related signal transduction protein